jgi:prolyl oligopeptidase
MVDTRHVALSFAALCALGCGANSAEPVAPPAPAPSAKAPAPAAKDESRKPPPTPKRPVLDSYHGVAVGDDYRWLENAADPEVRKWSDAQNAYTRSFLDALPDRDAIAKRARELLGTASADYFDLRWAGGRLFALEDRPPAQQPFLVVMKSPDDPASATILLDPNALDASGGTTIDFYVPSHDGKKVAVSLSKGGSESGTVHVYDVASGKETGDVIPRVQGGTAGGSVAFTAGDTRIFYTRYPHDGERPAADLDFFQQVYVHKLGAPVSSDAYSIGKDFPRIAEITLAASHDGKLLLARVANGDGGEFAHYLLGPTGNWTQIAGYADKVIRAEFGRDNALYVLSLSGAPRGKILRLSPRDPKLAKAVQIVAESKSVIQRFAVTAKRLYVVDLVGGPSAIRVFDLGGKPLGNVSILPVSAVNDLEPLDGDEILYRNQSYVAPPGWYRYRPATGSATRTALVQTSPADFSDAEVTRDMCKSKDGTLVPINIVAPKGARRDGKNPTLLTGYGGYGVSRVPRFRAINRLWLDQGGIVATTNLRGGGEFGEEWHHAGYLEKKQNVFDDFAACAKRLGELGLTGPDELAIIGGSNGGLLMGAEIVQHPSAFKAVVSFVGIYDMLRVETTPNGAFNVTEFGSVKDESQFRALYAYSPYHNVKDGTAYPATLMLTGANDPRVDPYNSRKMVARLQSATSSSAPILLRTSSDTGHGIGNPLNVEIAEDVDVYSFLFHALGIRFRRN